MKNRTGDIRFLFMTGVSKFTRLSIFSALSNVVDVSQKNEFATMFGYTEEELSANCEEHFREHAARMGKSYEDYRAELRRLAPHLAGWPLLRPEDGRLVDCAATAWNRQ